MHPTLSKELESIFCGDSQMASALRMYNWEETVLGPVQVWPEALKNSIRIILNSAYPMFVWWGQDMIMFYNDAYIPVLGPKHPESIGQSGRKEWTEIWHIIGPLMENVLQKGEACYREKDLLYTERNCFKEETYYTYSYSPIYNADGSVGGIFCACHEDTPQVLSERRLTTISRISGIRADTSVDAARQEVMTILSDNPNDLAYAVLYTLEAGQPTIAYYSESAFANNLHQLPGNLPSEMLHLTNPEIPTISIVPTPEQLKQLLKVPEHGQLPELSVVMPVRDSVHNLVRAYLQIGISPVLPLDDHYMEFLNLLSAQVNATVTNVRAFEQERLMSRKLLELDKAKTDFFSNVSHEFRTPLTLIMGPLELLLQKADQFTEEDRANLQVMHRNGLRLLKQVNNLLSFTFVEAGKHKATFAPTDLAGITQELASTFQSVMEEAGLTYTFAIQSRPEQVYIDADMWEIIVLNLLSNAYKFTFTGSIAVQLTENEREVQLHVTDTGIGIPEKDLPNLFERFHRVEQNVGRTIDGSGIGLALVAELVKLHGGSVKVESKVGHGSRFIVAIPKGSSHLPQDLIGQKAEASGQETGFLKQNWPLTGYLLNTGLDLAETIEPASKAAKIYSPGTATVLLVDDNPDMLAYLKRLLESSYRILTAANGQVALEMLQQQSPELILCDVMMPVMDGVTLLNKVRGIPALAAVPFILLSARAADDDVFLGFNTGADDYLVKPFSANELITRVRASISNARVRNEWKEKEKDLLEETARRKVLLESILSSISDAFYHINPDLEFVYVNKRAVDLTGKTIDEHIGKKILEVYPYIAGTELYQKILQAIETLEPATLEHYDEVLGRWFDCRLYPSAVGSTAYFADITVRKQEEQARLETENRFREMANAAPVLIWMSGTDMLCNFFNDNWLKFRGRTHEQEYGYGWLEGVHPDDADLCINTYTNAFKEGRPFNIEYRLLNKKGIYRWVLDVGAPRFTDDGQLQGYIGACTDITELKWAESLLFKYNIELEQNVEARTMELQQANEQLKKEIEEKVKRKKELTRSHQQLQQLTSHLQDLRENERKLIAREIHDELGQALSALKIEILLLYDRISGTRSKYKHVMLESLGSMEEALDESLVSLRKIISQLRPSLSDDLELVHELRKLAAELDKRTGLPVVVRSGEETIELQPDIAIEVYRVVQESVTNILKHAGSSTASIDITKENSKFKFRVTDNGVGFDENVLSEKSSFGILGMKERAQRIGAELTIVSGPGKGTTVELLVDAGTS